MNDLPFDLVTRFSSPPNWCDLQCAKCPLAEACDARDVGLTPTPCALALDGDAPISLTGARIDRAAAVYCAEIARVESAVARFDPPETFGELAVVVLFKIN